MDRATPAICAAGHDQPRTNLANSSAPANGAAKLTAPRVRLGFQLRRRLSGSISAPARNVSTAEPKVARKLVNSVCCTTWSEPGMLPTTAPTTSSINATEIPTRMLIRLASRARPIHAAATQ